MRGVDDDDDFFLSSGTIMRMKEKNTRLLRREACREIINSKQN